MANAQDSAAASSGGKRLQLALSDDALRRLDSLLAWSEANSYADVFRNALRLYEWYMLQRKQGYDIALLKDGMPVRIVDLLF